MTGMTEEQAQEFINDYFAKFKVLQVWLEQQGNMAIGFGYTVSADGRRRFYVMPPKSDPDYEAQLAQIRRWAGNHPIQASNADMLKIAIRKIYEKIRGGIITGEKLFDARLSLVVHDEIVMICLIKDVAAVKQIMIDSMNEAYEELVQGVWNEVIVMVDEIWEKQ